MTVDRQPYRRFARHGRVGGAMAGPAPDSAAMRNLTTIFPKTVVEPDGQPLLKSGKHSSKIGDRVTRGPWNVLSIYTLTLEERATCSPNCHHLRTCMGNGMPMAVRFRHGPALEAKLGEELAMLERRHGRGFVVRLHVLGDFYSVEYVSKWLHWMNDFPLMRVYGYTNRQRSTAIGMMIDRMNALFPARFRVRFSVIAPTGAPGETATAWAGPEDARQGGAILCPAQLSDDVACGSCGLCWLPKVWARPVMFLPHGSRHGGRVGMIEDTEARDEKLRLLWLDRDTYWTVEEIAKKLNVSPGAIRQRRKQIGLPPRERWSGFGRTKGNIEQEK